jgi:hypothetical protein
MYTRDFGILILSVCAVYLSLQNEGPFSFKPAWCAPAAAARRHHCAAAAALAPAAARAPTAPSPPSRRYHHFGGEEGGGAGARGARDLPPPLAADLNGDGKPELVAALPGGRLAVLAPRRPGRGFAAALVLHEVALAPLIQGRRADVVALAVGHLTPRPAELVRAPRKQVVVALTADLDVLALDHNLRLLWRRPLGAAFPAGGSVREAALLVTEHAMTRGDRGAVLVGTSVTPRTLADRQGGDGDPLAEAAAEEVLERAHAAGRAAGAALDEVRGDEAGGGSGRHFTYFALDGGGGEERWRHAAPDFRRDLGALRDAPVRSAAALHGEAQLEEGPHYGEASCRDFREAVLRSLPHAWHARRDTALRLGHWEKHRAGRGAQKERLSTLAAEAVRGARAGAAAGAPPGAPPRGGRAAAPPPNVVVAHLEEGIEAVHLFSGRPVCRLHLPAPGLHADLNGDGIPDYARAVGGDAAQLDLEAAVADADVAGRHRRLAYCAAVVTTGVPPVEPLFNGTICMALRARALHRDAAAGAVAVAPPAALPVPGRGGRYAASALRQRSLALFLNSRGELSAYGAAGGLEWQAATGASWPAGGEDAGGLFGAGADEGEEVEELLRGGGRAPFEPTLAPLALRRHALPTAALVAGAEAAAVLSDRGAPLDWLALPERPAQPLAALDFSADGYTDLVLVADGGLYGWAQVRRPGAGPFSALVGGLIVAMAAVFISQQGFMRPAGAARAAKGRSTDRVD